MTAAVLACCRYNNDDGETTRKSMDTEYNTEYQAWPYQEKEQIRPPSNRELSFDASGQHDMKTMYEQTYVNHPRTSRTLCIRPQQNQHNDLQEYFHYISTYKDNFRDTYGLNQRRRSFRPCLADGKFITQSDEEKLSVSHETYRRYSNKECSTAKRAPIIIKPDIGGVIPKSEDIREEKTTVQDNFKWPGLQKRTQSIIPCPANSLNKNCRMNLLTTNKADFDYKLPDPCQPVPILVKEKGTRENWRFDPFNHRSTVQDDYIQHPFVLRPKSFKPLQHYVVSETPFQPQTLYKDDFKQLPYQGPPKPYKLDGNLQVRQKCPFQGSTQYTDEFVHPPASYRRRQFSKSTPTRALKGKFYDDTSYSMNFRQFDNSQTAPRVNFKPVRKYKPPTIAFQVESTAHAHYKGEQAPPSTICNPKTKPRINDAKCSCSC
uniref:stabilizer of axonemal microtubules 1-like n=1 Tax=Styela clava TaxID=7725 RepID=UPI00193A2040|nr:stabilizer of axonemal microtubules 1-like [Styela clava]